MKTIENLNSNVIFNSSLGNGDARIIQIDSIDKVADIIYNHQLNFKELILLQPQTDKHKNDFNLTSPATYMNSFLRFIYMYEHDLLEIRQDQPTYTYGEMKHKAYVKYQKCKMAEKTMLANEWRFLDPVYIKALKCYNGTYIPRKYDLNEFEELYEEHKNEPLCSIHIEMLKTVISHFSFDVSAAKNKLEELLALKEINETAGYPNSVLNQEIEKLQSKIEAA